MENKVANIAAAADPAFGAQRPVQPGAEISARPPEAESSADFRLVIEQDAGSGAYIYKTVDRRTGEIVQQLPRDQILRMREASEYAAGGVIRARA